MNKKISPVLAILIILIVALIIGTLFYLNIKNINQNKLQNQMTFKQNKANGNSESNALVSNWKLISGDESVDCMPHIYAGSGKISGWYSLEDVYDQKQWMFRIVSGQENIPFKGEVISLVDVSQELVNNLKKTTKDNPMEITIQGISCGCEGCSASIAPAEKVFANEINNNLKK